MLRTNVIFFFEKILKESNLLEKIIKLSEGILTSNTKSLLILKHFTWDTLNFRKRLILQTLYEKSRINQIIPNNAFTSLKVNKSLKSVSEVRVNSKTLGIPY